jgi:hypothetical protein
MVASLVLAFYHWGQVHIRTVSALGAAVEIGRPAAVEHGLWLVWAYFLLRYYQYFRREPTQPRKSEWQTYRDDSAKRWAERRGRGADDTDPWGQPRLSQVRFTRRSWFRWSASASTYDAPRAKLEEVGRVDVGPFTVLRLRLRALLAYVLRSSHFTDYWLPYLMAVAAAVLAVYSHLRWGHAV